MKKLFLYLIAFFIFVTGCNQKIPDMVGAYTTVIDEMYNEDKALNSNIKYIAIDTETIINLNDEEKAALLKELEKYGFAVLDMSFEELEEKGYIKDLYFDEGILFKIEDKEIINNSITMDVSKWRSGLGAIGYNNLVVKHKGGRWVIIKTGNAWIS